MSQHIIMKQHIMQKVVEINKHEFLKYLLFSIIQLHKFKTEMAGILMENKKQNGRRNLGRQGL